jgi:hypothetical protein
MTDVTVRTAWTVLNNTEEVLRLLRVTHARVLLSEAEAQLDVTTMFDSAVLWAGIAADADAFQDELQRQCAEHLGVSRVVSASIDPVLGDGGEITGVALRVEVLLTPNPVGRKSAGAPAGAAPQAPAAAPPRTAGPVARSKSAPPVVPAVLASAEAEGSFVLPTIEVGPPRTADTPVLPRRKNRPHDNHMVARVEDTIGAPVDARTVNALVAEQWAAGSTEVNALAFQEQTANLQRGAGSVRFFSGTGGPRPAPGPPQVSEARSR